MRNAGADGVALDSQHMQPRLGQRDGVRADAAAQVGDSSRPMVAQCGSKLPGAVKRHGAAAGLLQRIVGEQKAFRVRELVGRAPAQPRLIQQRSGLLARERLAQPGQRRQLSARLQVRVSEAGYRLLAGKGGKKLDQVNSQWQHGQRPAGGWAASATGRGSRNDRTGSATRTA